MKKLLVIGIGSRIMMDDAIGIYIVEDLKKQSKTSNVAYVLGETDVDYCMEEVLDYEQVIVIDAFLSGKQPGELTIVPLEELDNRNDSSLYSTHGTHFLNKLQNRRNSQAVKLIGIEPCEINYGFTLSESLQERYTHIFYEVSGMIAKYANEYVGRRN